MITDTGFPPIETRLPEMTAFVSGLAQDYQSGDILSWQMMAERVHAFFTPNMLDEVDAIALGWRDMSSYDDGVTLVHVMCVFTGLLTCPEFQHASRTQQGLMKWIILFHDIAKEVRDGQRDFTHGFRSAAKTGAILPRIGFAATAEYDNLIDDLANGHPHDLTRISGPVAVDRRLLTAEIVCIAPFYDGLPFEVYGWKHRKATFLANFLSNWRGVR